MRAMAMRPTAPLAAPAIMGTLLLLLLLLLLDELDERVDVGEEEAEVEITLIGVVEGTATTRRLEPMAHWMFRKRKWAKMV